MPTVLVVEDQPEMLELIRMYLTSAGLTVIPSSDGQEALRLAELHPPDLVLLDVMLPGLDGWQICKEIRQKSHVPIIMVTAKSEEVDRILGLELGADDYVIKPFSPRELVARVRALLRRMDYLQGNEAAERIRLGGLCIDRVARRTTLNQVPLELTPKEFDLLWFLARHPGQAFSREQLLEQVWGYAYEGSARTVDALVKRLRRKIEDDPDNPVYVETVRGVGYRCVRPQD